jgi:hypothetical protein
MKSFVGILLPSEPFGLKGSLSLGAVNDVWETQELCIKQKHAEWAK